MTPQQQTSLISKMENEKNTYKERSFIREETRAKSIEERKFKNEKRKNMKTQLGVNFIEKNQNAKQGEKLQFKDIEK